MDTLTGRIRLERDADAAEDREAEGAADFMRIYTPALPRKI
jgi:hypothetical protein